MAELFAIKTNFVDALIAKISGPITTATRRDLAIVFEKQKQLAKPEKTRDGLNYPHTVVTNAITDSRQKIKTAATIMQDFTIWC